jgi:hypothetical protein
MRFEIPDHLVKVGPANLLGGLDINIFDDDLDIVLSNLLTLRRGIMIRLMQPIVPTTMPVPHFSLGRLPRVEHRLPRGCAIGNYTFAPCCNAQLESAAGQKWRTLVQRSDVSFRQMRTYVGVDSVSCSRLTHGRGDDGSPWPQHSYGDRTKCSRSILEADLS